MTTLSEMKTLMKLMADVLEEAQNGLEWYWNERPECVGDVDYEMNRRINKALAEYRKLEGK